MSGGGIIAFASLLPLPFFVPGMHPSFATFAPRGHPLGFLYGYNFDKGNKCASPLEVT
jgi:hypothetical protein